MSREIDTRRFTGRRATLARRAELQERATAASDALPGDERVIVAEVDPATGNTSRLDSLNADTHGLTGESSSAEFVARALGHVRAVQPALGISAEPAQEFVADPHPLVTSSGARAVHLTQEFKGIGIFHAAQVVRFSPAGAIRDVAGAAVDVTEDLTPVPSLTADAAVRSAAEHVAAPDADEVDQVDPYGQPWQHVTVDLAGWTPELESGPSDGPRAACVFAAGPFGTPIRSQLVWFPHDPDTVRLAYEVLITLPPDHPAYEVVVDAHTGRVLYASVTTKYVQAKGTVFTKDPRTARQLVDFPFPVSGYPIPPPAPPPLPTSFPEDWVDVNQTLGNNVSAHFGATGLPLTGAVASDGVLRFDTPADPLAGQSTTANLFFYCNLMHDIYYRLGFREADGNFQADNRGRGGLGGDRVDAQVFSGLLGGLTPADFTPTVDGTAPTLRAGSLPSTGRFAALDSSVIFHEYTHGVTTRLVGGGAVAQPLQDPQSAGMGEGWGDYVACTLNQTTVVGDWITDSVNGVRRRPYDAMFPDDFADLGTPGAAGYVAVHEIGEIWGAVMVEISRRTDPKLLLQLAVDSWKLTMGQPSFLEARQTLFIALEDARSAHRITEAQYAATGQAMAAVFARFGMGFAATTNAAFLDRCIPDYDVAAEPPCAVSWSPNRLDIFDANAVNASSAHKWWGGTAWGPTKTTWENLKGNLTSTPVYVSWGPDRLDGFALGNDRAMWHQSWDGRGWSGWETLHSPRLRSKPAAVCWAANRIDVFALGPARDLQHLWWDGARWNGWESLGGFLLGPPTVVSWAPNRLDIFAQGADGALWHRWYENRWGAWESLGGDIIGQPEAVCWGPNRIDVFAVGKDAALIHQSWNGTTWSGWATLGGWLLSAPAPVAWDTNRLDVFAIGTDMALWHLWWNGTSWANWETLGGGPFQSRPAAVSWAPNRLDVFARRASSLTIDHRWYENRWGSWESLGGTFQTP